MYIIDFRYFNSIKVQLKPREEAKILLPIIHFNSIKVQLKQYSEEDRNGLAPFQFHKGTIKTVALSES